MGSINVDGACFVAALGAAKIFLYSQKAGAGRRPLKGSPVWIARHGKGRGKQTWGGGRGGGGQG